MESVAPGDVGVAVVSPSSVHFIVLPGPLDVSPPTVQLVFWSGVLVASRSGVLDISPSAEHSAF